ncbi:ABC transporter substrate-binding protein [Volucribacter amazonae]|uniref:ABC transporter substrate-binding protein n=1 Tax=Volucribacter amazonae TaxID=256731 RepID=A0A9X4SI54_9PAST|nr:ABC transporter substrate-binding protein [Volucribacter amazonae]MDG6895245.1 ABC transporter substrate-binding protein [Volucribacter amazonae]
MKKVFYTMLATLLLLVACDNQQAQSSAEQIDHKNVEQQQSLVVVTPWEITSTDPSKSGYIFQRLQLAETLVEVEDNGRLVAGLATDWQHNDDASVWIFNLRPNVKFHDGSLLTADEVVTSLQVALTKPTALRSALIEEIKALNPLQVQITLKQGLVFFPAYLAHSTAIILAKSAFDAEQNIQQIVGTGPYQVVKIEPPQKIEQVAFKDYWGEPANIERVDYLANSRSETRTLLAQSQPNYLVFNLDAASVHRLQQDSNLAVQTKSIARTIQYKVNVANPLFADVRVRRALSDAIDRQGIAQSVLRIQQGEAEQIFPPAFADWRLEVAQQQPNYAEIQQRLLELGFQRNAQGELEMAGKPVKFTLRTFSDRPELPLIATALQDQWKQLGITVEVAIGNFSEIPAGHQDGSLEMALFARNYGMIPDPTASLLTDFAPEGSDWGVMNWQNVTLTQALQQLQITFEPSQQRDLKQQIAQIIYTERPITPIVFYQQNVASHKSLKGLELDPFERSFRLNKLSW